MIRLLLIALVFLTGCATTKPCLECERRKTPPKGWEDFEVKTIAGGSYVDKYGITWDWVGINDETWYEPRIDLKAYTPQDLDPPKVDPKVLKYYRYKARKAGEGELYKYNKYNKLYRPYVSTVPFVEK